MKMLLLLEKKKKKNPIFKKVWNNIENIRQKSVQLVDNPVQAAVEHFPETFPPLLAYLWFAFQLDCSNWHPAKHQNKKGKQLAPAPAEIL